VNEDFQSLPVIMDGGYVRAEAGTPTERFPSGQFVATWPAIIPLFAPSAIVWYASHLHTRRFRFPAALRPRLKQRALSAALYLTDHIRAGREPLYVSGALIGRFGIMSEGRPPGDDEARLFFKSKTTRFRWASTTAHP
jgi:hypothetical protein